MAAALGLRAGRDLAAVLLVNLVTNPPLNLAVVALAGLLGDAAHARALLLGFVLVGEAAVVLIEWRLLVGALGGSRRRLLGVSAAMNAASFVTGVLVYWMV